MADEKTLVYLAELTHTGQMAVSNMFPLTVGLLGAFLRGDVGDSVAVELYKYPQDLSRALSEHIPRVIRLSNYSWNCDLSFEYTTPKKTKP